jgi:hypothetical protein
MSQQTQSKQRAAVKAVRTASKTFSNQALALDRIFNRAVSDAEPGGLSFHQDMRMALRAQAQYRATLKLLLALEGAEAACRADAPFARRRDEKSRNSSKQTNEGENH